VTPVHDSQLLKGVLSLLLLHLLAERESYGYEVVQRLQEIGLFGIAEGSVYPALARLEREGRVESRLIASRSGPARKYYRPTSAGRRALEDGTASWLSLAELVTPLLARRPPSTPTAAEDA
jgi:PadR family transcriptional regulator PadR